MYSILIGYNYKAIPIKFIVSSVVLKLKLKVILANHFTFDQLILKLKLKLKIRTKTKSITFTKLKLKPKISAVIISFSTLTSACNVGHVYIHIWSL